MATNQEAKVSIFNALRYGGENFFISKETMRDVKTKCDDICIEYQNKFKQLHNPAESKDLSFVDDILFRKLKFEEMQEKEYEKRLDIQDDEMRMIKEACKKGKIHEDEIENIIFSLGYKTQNSTYKKPCVAVVGQTKSGKSSLINSVLQDRVVPQKVVRQTARVTYVTHCTTKFVAYMKDSRLQKIEVGSDVKDEDVDLRNKDRINESEISVEIRVGTTNCIVQNGFDIVDCPGLNENPKLNDLCKRMEKSLLPLLIYVVDGRNSLQNIDIQDIYQIRKRTPELKIIYFVTKLARSKYDRLLYLEKKAKKKMKEGEDLPGESDIEVAQRRLDKVLRKAKQHLFVPQTTKILESKVFFGADLWAVNELRIDSPGQTGPAPTHCDEYNIQLMNHFEENLMLELKDRLERPIKEEVKFIQTPLEEVLEKATSLASEIAEEKTEKKTSLKAFKENENDFYHNELQYIETSLRKAINKMIDDSRARLLEIITEVEMSESERGGSRKKQRMQDPFSSDFIRLEEEVKRRIEESLDEEIKAFVTKFMVDKETRLRQNLCRIVKKLTKGKYGSSSFEIMLQNRLFYEYEFFDEVNVFKDSESIVDEQSNNISHNSKSVRHIVELVKQTGKLTASLFKISETDAEKDQTQQREKISPEQKNWKDKITDKILKDFDRASFLQTICEFVTQDFERRHKQFVKQLEEQEKFLEANLIFGDEEKKCVRSFSEQLGVQYAKLVNVRTPLYIMINPLIQPVNIGEGGQAKIKKVQLVGSKEHIVVKTYEQTFRDFETSDRLPHIAMEIYYSSRLRYRHCLELLGINFEKTSEGWQFSAYYPYLEMGSLKGYLETKEKKDVEIELKERMELCIELADGIRFLHRHQIVHRDINLKNVLVRKPRIDEQPSETSRSKLCEVEAVISDYGLTKSFGFIEHTDRVGTLLYIAPELFNKQNLNTDGYSSAVDVFSFGICAWQLLSYKLIKLYDNYYPRFAIDSEMIQATIEKLVMDGERPEERDKIPQRVRYLLERCWQKDPNIRPSFIKPYKEVLAVDLDPNDPLRDRTIYDELLLCSSAT